MYINEFSQTFQEKPLSIIIGKPFTIKKKIKIN